jgi:hypothetical protein
MRRNIVSPRKKSSERKRSFREAGAVLEAAGACRESFTAYLLMS